jgi:hypothetical protein
MDVHICFACGRGFASSQSLSHHRSFHCALHAGTQLGTSSESSVSMDTSGSTASDGSVSSGTAPSVGRGVSLEHTQDVSLGLDYSVESDLDEVGSEDGLDGMEMEVPTLERSSDEESMHEMVGYDPMGREDLHDEDSDGESAQGMGGNERDGDVHEEGWASSDEDDAYTAERLAEKLDDPLYPGSRMTLAQACYLAMHEKREGRIRDGVFDRQCRTQHEVLLPRGNTYPGSLYLLRKLIGCEDAHHVSMHMCVNGCQSWEHQPRRLWKHHADDACATCGSARFQRGPNGSLNPLKEFFYLGLKRAIQHQFCMDEFRVLRGVARPESGRYTNEYYASPECHRLHSCAGIPMMSADEVRDVHSKAMWDLYASTSVWDVGMDFFQPYDTRAYSIGLILLRCADLPDQVKNQVKFSSVVGITVGPKEPPKMDAYLQPLVTELKHAWKDGVDVLVPDGNGGSRVERHRVLLGGVFADEPASKKISKWKLHGSYLACGFCNCRGVLDPDTNTVRYPPVMQYGFYEPGAPSSWLSPSLQLVLQLVSLITMTTCLIPSVLTQLQGHAGP